MFRVLTIVHLLSPTRAELSERLCSALHFHLGYNWDVTIREPGDNSDDPRVREWHQEGEAFTDAVFWSNVPTEFRRKDNHAPLIAGPCEMVWIDNHAVEHRQPPEITEPRWFFRAVGRLRQGDHAICHKQAGLTH